MRKGIVLLYPNTMLQKLISGVVIVDGQLKITHSNRAFVNILGEEAAMVDEVIPGLIGASLKTLLPVPFYKLFSYVLTSIRFAFPTRKPKGRVVNPNLFIDSLSGFFEA